MLGHRTCLTVHGRQKHFSFHRGFNKLKIMVARLMNEILPPMTLIVKLGNNFTCVLSKIK